MLLKELSSMRSINLAIGDKGSIVSSKLSFFLGNCGRRMIALRKLKYFKHLSVIP